MCDPETLVKLGTKNRTNTKTKRKHQKPNTEN